MPLYNEGHQVTHLVAHLRQVAGLAEAVLVDASDQPSSLAVIDTLRGQLRNDSGNDSGDSGNAPVIRLIKCPARGRAVQMNAGAGQCGGSIFLFLHCDTRLPPDAAQQIIARIDRGHLWGWFDLRLDANGAAYRLIEQMINLRSRLCGIATGDQAMFIRRRVFERQRGFAEIPLMEDVEMSRRLKRLGRPGRIAHPPVVTSARRWQKNGVLRTVLLMWKLRFLYWLGGNPERLAAIYRNVR